MVPKSAAWALALLLLLAGCVGGGKGRAEATASMAPEPTASAGFGSVSGLLVNDEDLPVVGADVGLLKTAHQAQSDAAGRFTFNDVEPGEYDLAVAALGFEPAAQRIAVAVGEVTNTTVKVKALALPVLPIVRTVTYNGFLQCSYNPYYFVNPCGDLLGKNVDHFRFELDKDLPFKQILLELLWTPTTAATAQELELDLCVPPDDPAAAFTGCFVRDTAGEFYVYESGPPPLVMNLTDEEQGNRRPALPHKEFLTYEAWVGNGITSPTPAFQQPFTLHVTTCYVATCPKGASALPPPA